MRPGKTAKSERQERATERVAATRSPEQQLDHLDTVFGVGKGAKKERAKLLKRFAAEVDALEPQDGILTAG